MRKFNFGKSRVIVLRKLLGYSQKDFAERICITQGALSQIETGKSQASFDTIKKISDEFNVNCNWLIKGVGRVEMERVSEIKTEKNPTFPTEHMHKKVLIPFVSEAAHAGYIPGDEEYIKTLDSYQIPGFEKGNYRLFEIIGDSMIPTLFPKEIVVCEFVKAQDNMENASLCVLITKEGIVAKRIFYNNDKTTLLLKSDNSEFKPYSIPLKEIVEVWLIKAKITSLLNNTTNALIDINRIEQLEADMMLLKNQVKTLKNENPDLS